MAKNVVAARIPYVWMEGIVDQDVVLGGTMKSLAELQSSIETDVVVDMVVARPIVEVDVPAVVASPAIIMEHDRLAAIPQGHVGIPGPYRLPQVPKAVAAPGVERSVIAGFLHRVEDVTILDHVAAPTAVADV